jgi:hypothetical protein
MFYVKTETDNHIITTSYVSEKQARRYGGEPFEAQLRLMDDGFTAQVIDYHPEQDGELIDIGQVRTIFSRKTKNTVDDCKFRLYMQDEENEWYYTGISFATMSDANQAVKGPLSGHYSDMMILENNVIVPTSKESSTL